jgi:hypothetical protein
MTAIPSVISVAVRAAYPSTRPGGPGRWRSLVTGRADGSPRHVTPLDGDGPPLNQWSADVSPPEDGRAIRASGGDGVRHPRAHPVVPGAGGGGG